MLTFGGVGTRRGSFVASELVVVLVTVQAFRVVPECLGAGTLADKDSGEILTRGGGGRGVLARLGWSVEGDERVGSGTLACASRAASSSGGFDGGGGSIDGWRYIGCGMRRNREGIFMGCSGEVNGMSVSKSNDMLAVVNAGCCLVGSAKRAFSSYPISNMPMAKS
jgi:hypothetical protein